MDPRKKKIAAPIIVTIFVVLYYIAYFGFLITLLDGMWKYILGLLPLALTVVMIKVCIERIHEIKKTYPISRCPDDVLCSTCTGSMP